MLCPVFASVAQCRAKFLTNFHQPKKAANCIIKNFKTCSSLPKSGLNLNCNLIFDHLRHTHTAY